MEYKELYKNSKSHESTIESIYVFNDSGICLASCNIRDDSIDENLVSSFFTAIKHFGEELIPSSEIKTLVMRGYKLFYNNYKTITFCVQCSEDIPNQIIQYILDEISNKFIELYGSIIANFDGEISAFSDFNNYLIKYFERPLIEKILEDFGYNLSAEGLILFDANQDNILFAKVKKQFSSKRQISLGGMLINFAKNFSNEFEGGNVNSILISTENKWICVAKKEYIYITVLFSRIKNIELNIVIQKTEETLNNVLEMLKINI
ncbi:MAG: hypothetical protein ACFFG0_33450 [Candidatus Thorarchaeota archaeon]